MPMEEFETIAKYDRLYGNLRDVCLRTKPSTIQNVDVVGRSETFIVETMRHETGDYIFIQCIDDKQQVTRLALPPKVANAIASGKESLSRRKRSASSKAAMKERMAAGFVPHFKKKGKK